MFKKSISVWQERACGGKNSEEIVRIRVHTTSLKFLLNQAFVHLCFVYAKYTSMDYYNIAEKQVLKNQAHDKDIRKANTTH